MVSKALKSTKCLKASRIYSVILKICFILHALGYCQPSTIKLSVKFVRKFLSECIQDTEIIFRIYFAYALYSMPIEFVVNWLMLN